MILGEGPTDENFSRMSRLKVGYWSAWKTEEVGPGIDRRGRRKRKREDGREEGRGPRGRVPDRQEGPKESRDASAACYDSRKVRVS